MQSTLFKSWEQDPPAIPRRSRFYPLEPCGIGTPLVESLSSYIVRLSEVHAVSVGDFVMKELWEAALPDLSRVEGYQPPSRIGNLINGFGQCAQSCIQGLQALTLRGDLHLLTLLTLREFLPSLLLFRRTRAWCPECYDNMNANGAVYEPLLWSLRLVEACSFHRRLLIARCPGCRSTLTPLAAFSAPGHCQKCGSWLGAPARVHESEIGPAERPSDYQLWCSKTSGEILGASPQLRPQALKDLFWRNVARLVNELADGNSAAFARAINCPTNRIADWVAARYPPRFDTLLAVSFALKIPILTLLTDLADDRQRTPEEWAVIKFCRAGSSAREATQTILRRQLRDALDEQPAPSLAELSRRLNCTRHVLKEVDPELWRKIADRHTAAQRQRGSNGHTPERICDLPTIDKLLRESLNGERTLSSNRLSRNLGYQNAGYMWNKFPDLCRAIREKVRLDRDARVGEIIRAVTDAIAQDPPPSVESVARRLGFTNSWALWKHARNRCNELVARQETYENARWEGIRAELQAILQEHPPPSVQSVLRRGGVFRALNHSRCKDLRTAIASRNRKHMRKRTEDREAAIRDEVWHVAMSLYEAGIYPSGPRVMRLLPVSSRKRFVAVETALRETLEKLPGASSLDQF